MCCNGRGSFEHRHRIRNHFRRIGHELQNAECGQRATDARRTTYGITLRAKARSDSDEERWFVAELLRIKGELVVREGAPQAAMAAEQHFLWSLDWARRQGALSWELRTSTSLARLQHDQGRTAEARTLLQSVYDRFSEGFETGDLKAAKAYLDFLR